MSSDKVQEMYCWLKEISREHLTASQTAQYILFQAVAPNDHFGRLLENSLKPHREQGVKMRNLMPLPLWSDVIADME